MKLADVVARFIAEQGVKHAFGVSGGASLHLIHGICDYGRTKFIPTAHESGSGFAADAYARISGFGIAIATSGPGATNLLTAISASYYDSIPVLYLTGNVATFRFGDRFGVRQYGFQETPIQRVASPICKYAVTIKKPEDILYQLGLAVSLAQDGRKGPVLVDIPDDIQRAEVDFDVLHRWPGGAWVRGNGFPVDVDPVVRMLQEARRPIFLWGAGIRPYSGAARSLARSLGIPVACTWGAIDLMHADDPLMAGGFGTHGSRGANFAVQNSDLIISIGSRLDTKSTANPQHFARNAKIVMVDIDGAEIRKFHSLGRKIDVGICADAGRFIEAMQKVQMPSTHRDHLERTRWVECVYDWKRRYQSKDDPNWKGVKPYNYIRNLSNQIGKDDIIVSDTGTALGYLMQAYPFKGERFIHAFNATPMGYGLPAAIGAAFASGRRVTLVTGDGSILMSLAELATLARHALSVRIILIANDGHAMCRQTQRQWLGGRYYATDTEHGLGFPDWEKLAEAFGIEIEIVRVDPNAGLNPQAKFGQPLEDADPQLPREEFRANMIVPPLDEWKKESPTVAL